MNLSNKSPALVPVEPCKCIVININHEYAFKIERRRAAGGLYYTGGAIVLYYPYLY